MQAGHRAPLLVAPCGFGKTVVFSYFTKCTTQKKKRTLILAHRDELIEQISKTLAEFEVDHSFIAAGRPFIAKTLAHVGSVFSVARRLGTFPAPDNIIIDEGHHAIKGSTWGKVLDFFPRARRIGVTATPERLGGEPLDLYDDLILGPTTAEAIENGTLCPFKIYAPSSIDISGVHMRGGDLARNELAAVSDKPSITGNAIAEYKKIALGKRAVYYCVTVQHARNVAIEFQSEGITAACIDGKMDRDSRKSLVTAFREGDVSILTSVDVVTEGFDLPAIEVVGMLRPTASLAWWVQASGRGLRNYPGKEYAIIIDHAGNVIRHGLPDDDRDWSLQGRASRKSGSSGPSVRVCPVCFAAQASGPTHCKFCGAVFPIKARKVEEREGDLVEVDTEMLRRTRQQGMAGSEAALVRLGYQRGLKHPERWAHHVFQARQRKKLMMGRAA